MRYLPANASGSRPGSATPAACVPGSSAAKAYFPWLPFTWLFCAYWPVRIAARAGQQSGCGESAFGKRDAVAAEQLTGLRHPAQVGHGHVVGADKDDVGALPGGLGRGRAGAGSAAAPPWAVGCPASTPSTTAVATASTPAARRSRCVPSTRDIDVVLHRGSGTNADSGTSGSRQDAPHVVPTTQSTTATRARSAPGSRQRDRAGDRLPQRQPGLRLLATGASTGGLFGLYRWEFSGAVSGPGPHFHKTMTESFYILTGSVSIYDGRDWRTAEPGDFLHVPAGGSHGFRNESGEEASMLLHFAPGAPREAYFEGLRPGWRRARSGARRSTPSSCASTTTTGRNEPRAGTWPPERRSTGARRFPHRHQHADDQQQAPAARRRSARWSSSSQADAIATTGREQHPRHDAADWLRASSLLKMP